MNIFHMIDIHIPISSVVRFLASEGLSWRQDEGLGYGVHIWLLATFGAHAPKPFRIFLQREYVRILGYSEGDKKGLIDWVNSHALPNAYEVLNSGMIAAKPIPNTWDAGRSLFFETLICPTIRTNGRERDAFLSKAEYLNEHGTMDPKPKIKRSDVYAEWLTSRINRAAEVKRISLQGFRLSKMARRTYSNNGKGRKLMTPTYPHALLRGELVVKEGSAFNELLRRGVGRHRSFGYGMILLRARI